MEVYAQPFWTPKAGNSEVEYEDAFYPLHIIEAKTNSFRFAIADGATETSFAKLWAQLLVKAVGKGRLNPECPDPTLSQLRSCWQRIVSRKSLPWYAEEKVRLGAFSSILGLSLSEDLTGRSWKACAIGDCCLFHVRGSNLLRSFPLSRSSEFNNRPRLISSIPECAANPSPTFTTVTDEWHFEDHFFMMSDALASWFLERYESGYSPWEMLQSLNTVDGPRDFKSWIADLRGSMLLKNDDVTLISISIAQDS